MFMSKSKNLFSQNFFLDWFLNFSLIILIFFVEKIFRCLQNLPFFKINRVFFQLTKFFWITNNNLDQNGAKTILSYSKRR